MEFKEKYKIEKESSESKYYKVYNKNGDFLHCINVEDEGKIASNEYLKGVTCFVINENGEILLEKRANTNLTPGKIDLVSGHIDEEEIGMQAMIRELGEEVGINQDEAMNIQKIELSTNTNTLPLTFESKGQKRNFFIDFYLLLRNKSNVELQSEEVKGLIWVPMQEAFEEIRKGRTKFPKNAEYENIFKVVEQAYLEKNNGKMKDWEKW